MKISLAERSRYSTTQWGTYSLHVDAFGQPVHDPVDPVVEVQPSGARQYDRSRKPAFWGHAHVLLMSSRSGCEGIPDRDARAMLVVWAGGLGIRGSVGSEREDICETAGCRRATTTIVRAAVYGRGAWHSRLVAVCPALLGREYFCRKARPARGGDGYLQPGPG